MIIQEFRKCGVNSPIERIGLDSVLKWNFKISKRGNTRDILCRKGLWCGTPTAQLWAEMQVLGYTS